MARFLLFESDPLLVGRHRDSKRRLIPENPSRERTGRIGLVPALAHS